MFEIYDISHYKSPLETITELQTIPEVGVRQVVNNIHIQGSHLEQFEFEIVFLQHM